MFLSHLKLRGLIRFGAGLNVRYWIAEARTQGYKVLVDGSALLY